VRRGRSQNSSKKAVRMIEVVSGSSRLFSAATFFYGAAFSIETFREKA